LLQAVDKVEQGAPLDPDLDQALQAAAGTQKESLSVGSQRRFSRGG